MTEQAPILILLCPLFGAILVTLVGMWRPALCVRVVFLALAGSLGCALVTLAQALEGGAVEYFLGGWESPLGIGIVLRIDVLNGLVVTVVTLVSLLTAVYSVERVPEETPGREPQFYTLYLLLTAGLAGMTITGDAFNLYVLLEVSSLTSYALVAMGDSKRGTLAAFHYVIMGTIGASFYLLGVGYLYIKTGTLNMVGIQEVLVGRDLFEYQSVLVAFIFITVGLWIKMAFFPLYGWLPNAYSFAPSTTGCILAPLMTKVSVYIMVRMMLTVFGIDYVFEILDWSGGIVWLAVLAILAGSALALAQTDLKKMLCYLIVAEVGYMVGGFWLANAEGMAGAFYHILSDAAMTLCLFLAASIFFRKTRTHSLGSLEGLFRRMPVTMVGFTVGALAMIGIPPTCGFFSKWYLIQGGIASGHWEYVGALLVSSLVNVVLFFRIFEIAYFGRLPDPEGDDGEVGLPHAHPHGETEKIEEAPVTMLLPLLAAAAAILLIGIYNADLVGWIREAMTAYGVTGGGRG